jgi:hypothetical protein
MLFSCHAMLIHTYHAAPLPFSDSAVSFVKVCVVAGNIRTASPTVQQIGVLLITTFVELCVVAGRSWMRAGCQHAVSGWPILIHTCHAMSMPHCAVALRSRFQNGMARPGPAWHVMACVNQTWLQCVNQMGKIQSKPLAAWHGCGMVCVNYLSDLKFCWSA